MKKVSFEQNAKDLSGITRHFKKPTISRRELATYGDQLIFKTKINKIIAPINKVVCFNNPLEKKIDCLTKFETKIMTSGKINSGRRALYDGRCNKKGFAVGEGKLTEINQNFIRDGEWKNGQFIKGTYSISYFVKYVGSFIDGKDGDSHLHGEGAEYHYKSKKDYINDKPIGHIKGFFVGMGNLLKGKITNAFAINYTEHNFIKDIHYEDLRLNKTKDPTLRKGKIFYKNGNIYEGKMFFDAPEGKGKLYVAKTKKTSVCLFKGGNHLK
jgi:hypothetical protein|tara:strand:- start:33 stop:839 length:807 start_codon:yes stop_codon:yes gene_type:complete